MAAGSARMISPWSLGTGFPGGGVNLADAGPHERSVFGRNPIDDFARSDACSHRKEFHMDITLEKLGAMDATELRTALSHLEGQLSDLHLDERGALRELDDEQQAEFDRLANLASRARRHLEIREQASRSTPYPGAFGGVVGATKAFDGDPLQLSRDQARDQALRVLDRSGLAANQGDQVNALLRAQITEDSPNVDGGYIARRTLITESDAYRSAFAQVISDPHPVLTGEEAAALRSLRTLDRSESRAMSEGTPSAGGYGVPVFIDPSIVMTAQGSANPIRRLARTETITTNKWKGVSSAGVTWSWDAEASAVSDDSPTLGQPEVDVHMARGFIPFSIEVGMDYPSFAAEMSRLLTEGYDELLAESFVTGSGTGRPRGLVTALDANTNVEVLLATEGTLAAADINKVWESLPDRFKGRANWLMSHPISDKIAAFGNGNNLSFVTVDFTQALQTLRTRPTTETAYMTDLTTSAVHTNVAVIGDFSNYLVAQRAGMSVELVPHLFDTTNNRPTGQRGLFAWARAGADSINDLGFRLLNQT